MTLQQFAANPWAILVLPAALYVSLAVAVGRQQAWRGEIKLAVAGTGIVLVSTWMISFAALMAFFRAAYIDIPLNALGPVAVDGEMAVGTITWIAVGVSGVRLADVSSFREGFRWLLSPRPYVALLVAGAAALSAIANAAHPYTERNHWPTPWSYGASAVPGIVMFAVIHQLVILFRILHPEPPTTESRRGQRDEAAPKRNQDEPEPEPEPPATAPVPPTGSGEPSEERPATQPARNGRRGATTLRKARAAYNALARGGKPVTGTALGQALGVSAPMGRRWKRAVEATEAKPTRFRVARRAAA